MSATSSGYAMVAATLAAKCPFCGQETRATLAASSVEMIVGSRCQHYRQTERMGQSFSMRFEQ